MLLQDLCSQQPDPVTLLGLRGQVSLVWGCRFPGPWGSGRFQLHSLDLGTSLLPACLRAARSPRAGVLPSP